MSSFNLENFPKDSGVYLMKNSREVVIYVGKAKNLKARIKQYFIPGRDSRPMIPFLVEEIANIDTIVVPTEREALLLENTLIKKHQPKYNAFLKDDKTFISLMVNHKHPWPKISLFRYKGKPPKDGLYFGPYTSAFAARQTYDLLCRLFPLRQCSDEELKRRTRPCLLYGIKRCIAPCVNLCTKEEYHTFVQGAIDFLKGEDKKILHHLRDEMEKAADKLEFEKAAALLQTIEQIEHVIQKKSVIAKAAGKDIDALALYRAGNEVMVMQLLFREGKLVGSEHYSFSDVIETDEELFSSLLLQLYQHKKPLPEEILLPLVPSKVLSEILGTTIHHPLKGEKKEIIEIALANAKATFEKEKNHAFVREKLLLDLQDKLKLSRFPERIECFDTSNLSGTNLVASMVAFTHGEYDKKRTRLYKIRDINKGDDYAAMHQVLSRRLIRAKEENDLPDLIIVDGGKGQLSTALKVIKELDIATVDVVAVAKQQGRHDRGMTEEQLFLPHHSEPIHLDNRSPLLFLLQKIRDAAHTRAIGFQRKKQKSSLLTSALASIPGIGPIKQKRLLRHFGSLEQIKKASEEQLRQVKGITAKDILAIKNS